MKEACDVGDVSKTMMLLSFKVIKITNKINEGYGLNDRQIELASEFAIMLHIKGLNMLQIHTKKKKVVELDVG
jgi:hypothetical protein